MGAASPARRIAGTGHLNRGFDGIFEIVGVVSRRFVSIAEVHAIRARAHLAQSEPEMARDRFGFSERHGFVEFVFGQQARGGGYRLFWRIRFLVALAPVWDLLLFAKNLFVAAKSGWHEVPPSRGEREAHSAVVGRIAAILPNWLSSKRSVLPTPQ